MTNFDKLVEEVEAAKIDKQKFEKGNEAAGTRLRTKMQNIKKYAQDVRMEVLQIRKSRT